MRLLRRISAPIAFLLVVAFFDATIRPSWARAQQAPQGGGATSAPAASPSADAHYDQKSVDALSSHLQSTGAPTAEHAAVPSTDADVNRALAALPTGGGSVSPQATALPSGAATQLGMGESFSTQLSTGGSAYSVPLALPSARGGAQPHLEVSYNSAGGFGIAGVGWSIGASAISRQTDRGLPTYDDRAQWHPQQDRFTFSGMELVPICTVQGTACVGALAGEVMPAWSNGYQYFRSRIEGGFLRFFWSPDHRTWRVQGKDGSNMELGVPLDGTGYLGALESNPDKVSEIFRWHLVRQYDSQGGANNPNGNPTPYNVVVYRHLEDSGTVYVSDLYDTTPAANPTTTDLSQYAHHTRLIYESRPDVSTSYRQGWYTQYTLRVARVDVSSKPFEGSTAAQRELVRRYHFGYQLGAHRSLLTSLQLEGRCPSAVLEDSAEAMPLSTCGRLPAMTFEYQQVATSAAPLLDNQGLAYSPFSETVQTLADSPPHSLDEAVTELADINADGLPDVLVTAGGLFKGRHGVYFNGLSAKGARGFGALDTMEVQPAGDVTDANVLSLDNPNVTTLDLDADGIVNMLHMRRANTYELFAPVETAAGSGHYRWQSREAVTLDRQDVKIDFTGDSRNVRVMDVNADGLVDIVYSSPTELQTFLSLGRLPGGDDQFGNGQFTSASTAQLSNDPIRTCAPWSSTPIRFSDPDVQLADMNGDGLTDIVRLRSGQILYWPGRGNGYFGTGKREGCPGGQFAVDSHIVMATAPHFGTSSPGTLLLNDVNGDGLADVVEVRAQGVDIYLNDNGTSFTDRHIISNTPFLPAASNYMRLTDINGSGTPDILWGAAYDYKYIDLTGGVTPDVLVKVSNGLGKTFELQYETSTDQMLAAKAAGTPWSSRAPVVVPVLKRTITRDNLERIQRPAGVYTAEYSYRDPYYEGRQREFRGFREATVTSPGDANSPTGYAHSVFQLGECPESYTGQSADVCSPPARWQDNWREALKGLPVLSESYDANGVYLGTEHTTYKLRQLYTGLDGRRVIAAMPIGKDGYGYDTASFDAATSTALQDEVVLELAGITGTEQRSVTVRASAGTAEVRSQTSYDDFGNTLLSTRMGCVSGCPNGVDETIFTRSTFGLPAGDASGWLWREQNSAVHGSVHTELRNQVRHTYDSFGQVQQSFATLGGTVALNRSTLGTTTVPNQSGGTGGSVELTLSTNTYDSFGHITFARAPGGRCSSGSVDPLYSHLPVTGRVYAGTLDPGTGCGANAFVHSVTYDRGLEAVLTSTSAQGQPSAYTYDLFGRLVSATHVDPSVPGQLAQQPSMVVEYVLPSDPLTTPYTMTHVRALTGATPNVAQYTDGWSFADGLGRTLASLSPADLAAGDGGDWVVSGSVLYDAKGAAAQKYDPWFYSGPLQAFITGDAAPTGPFASQQYDAFGRGTWTFDVGEVQGRAVYHALHNDAFDAEDLKQGGEHQNTYMTSVSDGHGRVVQQIARTKVGGTLEEHVTAQEYLPTGEVFRITRSRSGSPDVVRWMRYDTLGRMVLNVEPNTTTGFTADPNTATPPPGIRYAYNDAGDLVGYSDARGCGANYYYDAGGRLLAEDRARCDSSQAPYTAPDLTTGDGTEVSYRYDVADPDSGTLIDDGGTQLTVNSALLWGRVASVSSLGSKGVFRYDALGRATGGALRVQRAGAPSSTMSTRYAPRWYITQTTLDAADRPLLSSTGATVSQLLGTGNKSELTYSYSKRGVVTQIGGSYGTLFNGAKYRADGLVESFTLGDAAATTRQHTYDLHRRLESVQTERGALPLWSNPLTGNYTPASPTDDPTRQLLLEDTDITYDAVGNITGIVDNRSPSEWPAGSKPINRTFTYDDLYRVKTAHYAQVSGSQDAWQSPFAAELADSTRVQPSPQISFTSRVTDQSWNYDYLGNLVQSTDDQSAFWDRSTGDRLHGTATSGPDRVLSASNRTLTPGSARKGDLAVAYDAAGNVTDLVVKRDGPCLPGSASCYQRFQYKWDEVGQLAQAKRWDLANSAPAATCHVAACTPRSTTDTTCDGVDDNCNGQIDEGYVPQAATCGLGVCMRTTGMTSCVNGAVQSACVPGAPTAGNDALCDGVDGDCNGVVDDGCTTSTPNLFANGTFDSGFAPVYGQKLTPDMSQVLAAPEYVSRETLDTGNGSAGALRVTFAHQSPSDVPYDPQYNHVAGAVVHHALVMNGTTLRATFRAKSVSGSAWLSVARLWGGGVKVVQLSPTWQSYQVDLNLTYDSSDLVLSLVPSNTTNAQLISDGVFLLDDLELHPAPPCAGGLGCVQSNLTQAVNVSFGSSVIEWWDASVQQDFSRPGPDFEAIQAWRGRRQGIALAAPGAQNRPTWVADARMAVLELGQNAVDTSVPGPTYLTAQPPSALVAAGTRPYLAVVHRLRTPTSTNTFERVVELSSNDQTTKLGIDVASDGAGNDSTRVVYSSGVSGAGPSVVSGAHDESSAAILSEVWLAADGLHYAQNGIEYPLSASGGAALGKSFQRLMVGNSADLTQPSDSNVAFIVLLTGAPTAAQRAAFGTQAHAIWGVAYAGTATCGDHVVGIGEQCDDGNAIDTDACRNNCTLTCVPTSTTDTTCNGVDDNCNGQIDEGFVPGAASCGVGACRTTAPTSCVGGLEVSSCTPLAPSSNTDATCDGIDNDCSGSADEEYVATTGSNERTANDALNEPVPTRPADADLTYYYDGGGNRVLKTATDTAGVQRHAVYITGGLELRSTTWNGSDFVMDATTTSLCVGAGPATARIVYEAASAAFGGTPKQHVFLELADHLGSGTSTIDKETGELVEATTYQAYGATETDYRPGRWGSYREPYKFTGKEEDIEVGLQYFGARYYSPYLQVWISPDPVTVHDAKGDLNPYAYVGGRPIVAVDPDGRFFWFAVIAAVAIAAAVSATTQIANNGWAAIGTTKFWKNMWISTTVASVAAFAGGAVGGVVSGVVGAYCGATAGAVAGGVVGGAVGGGVGYAANAGLTGSKFDAAGFGAVVGGGALAGGLGAGAGAAVGGGVGGAAVGGAVGGGTNYAVTGATTGNWSASSAALSIGIGAASAVASYGVSDLLDGGEAKGAGAEKSVDAHVPKSARDAITCTTAGYTCGPARQPTPAERLAISKFDGATGITKQTLGTGREYGVSVYQSKGGPLQTTEIREGPIPTPEDPGSVRIPTPPHGTSWLIGAHSHPGGVGQGEDFSRGDLTNVGAHEAMMVAPSGTVRVFDPVSKTITIIRGPTTVGDAVLHVPRMHSPGGP